MLPAVFLSGNMTPISAMPEWMQPFTWLNPVRYEVEILRAVLLKAAGPRELWPQLVALLLFGVAILGSAAMRFRKRLS
jgi:ABC-2 type transport system permease protein